MVEVRPDSPATPAGDDHSHDIYTIANTITVLRLILVPIFFTAMVSGENDLLAFVLFATAASTDWLDGQIARRTGTVTAIGKAIDPLVDRLLIAAGMLGLYLENRLPLWVVVLLVVRDVYLGYGAWRLEQRYHHRLQVTFTGKLTTALLLTGFSLLILNWPTIPGLGVVESPALPGFGSQDVAAGIWLVYVGLVLSVTSAIGYTAQYVRYAREASSR